LTATIATRMVPLLALDARRIGEAQRCRPNPGGRLAVMRAITANALDRSLDVAATLEVRGYGSARRPARATGHGRATTLASPARRSRSRCWRSRCARRSRSTRRSTDRSACEPGCWPPHSHSQRSLRSLSAAGSCDERARARRVSYTYPEAPVPALLELTLEIAQGEFVVLAGGSAAGKSTLLGVACGLVPHFHGGRFDGRAEICGMSLRDHGRRHWRPRSARCSRIPRRRS